MRRLVPVIAALVLLVLGAAAAGADAAKPRPQVVAGAAHKVGGRVTGWFVLEGTAAKRSHLPRAHVLVGNSRGARAIGSWKVPLLRPGERRRMDVSARLPNKLAAGAWQIDACIGGDCLRLGHFEIGRAPGQVTHPGPAAADKGSRPPAIASPSIPISTVTSTPISTVPTDPIPFVAGEPFEVDDPTADYWAFVPASYDASNLTPTPLLIWLHGCGGYSEGDIWVVDPGAEGEPQDWLTIAPAEREGECWTPSADEATVMAALADAETHFNVDRQRVILAGYSSGGDLAYRTGFRHSSTFAGLLIENSTPFRDTESSAAESLAAATTKFHIVQLAHLQDTTYPIATVEKETNEVKAAGFPLELIERPGEHFNEPGEVVEGEPVPGTDADLRTYLLPHIDEGWLAPGP